MSETSKMIGRLSIYGDIMREVKNEEDFQRQVKLLRFWLFWMMMAFVLQAVVYVVLLLAK